MSNAHRPLLEQTSQIKRLDYLDQGRNDQLTSTSKIFISRQNFKVALPGKIFKPKIERKGKVASGLKHCIQNQKVSSSNPTRPLDPTSLQGS